MYASRNAKAKNANTENGTTEPPSGPLDEESLIEERRKRREAIKAKYRGPATPLLAQALHVATENKTPATADDSSASDKMAIGKSFLELFRVISLIIFLRRLT